ncbi:MAG: hypothetical protein P4L75_00925, partial [Clostridia bacterium]|nr:hypothetical protein [Clostridia bacterium]
DGSHTSEKILIVGGDTNASNSLSISNTEFDGCVYLPYGKFLASGTGAITSWTNDLIPLPSNITPIFYGSCVTQSVNITYDNTNLWGVIYLTFDYQKPDLTGVTDLSNTGTWGLAAVTEESWSS